MIGPGKYAPECDFVRVMTDAKAVVVIIVDGRQGEGFEVAVRSDFVQAVGGKLAMCNKLAECLRIVANAIEEDGKAA